MTTRRRDPEHLPHRDTEAERHMAATLSVQLLRDMPPTTADPANAWRDTADVIYDWLTGPVRLVITAGPPVDQTTGQITGNPGGNTMKDTEKLPLTVQGEDAKHQPTGAPADLTWTSDDETIATIDTDPSTGEVFAVAGTPGSTVITATWPDSPSGPISGTFAVDVTVGDVASLIITAGAPVPQ